MSKFQIALLVIFGFFILAAVIVFSVYKGASGSQANVVVWGTLPATGFNRILTDSPEFTSDKTLSVSYVEKKGDLAAEFTEALAQGKGPDLVLITQDELWSLRNKLTAIPFGSVSEASFKETFAQGGEVFLSPDGVYALPLVVDPLVLYYNRDILSTAAIAKPIAYWDEIYAATSALTTRDAAGNLTQTTIALGETRNISHAKDILSLLFLQAGTPITQLSLSGLQSVLTQNPGLPVSPAESALDFYTQFANPSKSFYTWNRSLPEAQTSFAAGDSAYYLGFASEYKTIRSKSPTLNFAVTTVPQSRVAGKATTYGSLYALAISRGSKNMPASLAAALKFISSGSAAALSGYLELPPMRRDLLANKPTDAIGPVFYAAALQARGWLDPDAAGSETVFKAAVDAVVSGRSRVSEAVSAAQGQLDRLIK